MKKKSIIILGVLLILSLTIVLAGCGDDSGSDDAGYSDGTYTGYSDADDHGYGVAEVTVTDGAVSDVVLYEITELGLEKDYESYPYAPSGEAKDALPEKFIAANSAAVDVYSGASSSSNKYIQAVERALAIASGEAEGLFDGTFMGKSSEDDHGFALALVTLEDGVITEVVLNEVVPVEGEEGQFEFKDYDNYPYEPSVNANQELPAAFVEANSAEVEIFTGATHSSEKYMEAVADALEMAKAE